MALVLVALVVLAAVIVLVADRDGIAADQSYQANRAQLLKDLEQAKAVGYTSDDLAPVTSELAALDRQEAPIWVGDRVNFSQRRNDQLVRLQADLRSRETGLLSGARDDASQRLAAAKSAADRDHQLEVPDSQLGPLSQRLNGLAQDKERAANIRQVRNVAAGIQAVMSELTQAGSAQEQENSAIQLAANALVAQTGGNLDAVRKVGSEALFNGRNDASIAAYEGKGGRFQKIDGLMSTYDRIEHYAARLGSSDLNQVAFGSAAVQRYTGQVHTMLLAGLKPKHIIVSFQAQHVWAYQNGQVVMNSAVTSGIRGATAYGTDFGPMKILWRSHPWKMHSPFPKGSPYWYPDTMVQWTAFFTNSGESFHDASWEPDSELGPGSQYTAGTRSHGCIHVPYYDAQWMFNWAEEGTPVDVYPGDGSPVANQLSLMTTDNHGNPLNPA